MRGRHHLDQPAGEIEAAIGAALDHALELFSDVVRAEVAHGNVQTAVRRGVAVFNLRKHRARDDVAGRALGFRIVAAHEALALPI